MRSIFAELIKDETGVTAIEYGMIVGLIAIAVIAVITGLGNQLITVFQTASTAM